MTAIHVGRRRSAAAKKTSKQLNRGVSDGEAITFDEWLKQKKCVEKQREDVMKEFAVRIPNQPYPEHVTLAVLICIPSPTLLELHSLVAPAQLLSTLKLHLPEEAAAATPVEGCCRGTGSRNLEQAGVLLAITGRSRNISHRGAVR